MTDAAPAGPTTTTQPDLSSAGGPTGVQDGGAGAAASGAPPAAPVTPDWTSTLPEATKLYVQNKGFKDPNSVLDSYQNLEKLMGAPKERLLKLPEKFDAPEMSEVYDRLGRPKDPTGYTFKAPEGSEVNKEFTDFAQKMFHETGLSKSQGEKIAEKWNEYATGLSKQAFEKQAADLKVEQTALKKEWGATHEQQIKACFRAAQTFGLGQEEVTQLEKAIGYSKTMKFLASIGAKVGEGDFVGTENGGFQGAMTPARAQAEIDELKKDKEFVRKYAAGDRESFQKMSNLMRYAYPDLPVEG